MGTSWSNRLFLVSNTFFRPQKRGRYDPRYVFFLGYPDDICALDPIKMRERERKILTEEEVKIKTYLIKFINVRSEFKTQPILCINSQSRVPCVNKYMVDRFKWSTEARQNLKSVKLWIIIIKYKMRTHNTLKHTNTLIAKPTEGKSRKAHCMCWTQILSCTYWFEQSFKMSFRFFDIFGFVCLFIRYLSRTISSLASPSHRRLDTRQSLLSLSR